MIVLDMVLDETKKARKSSAARHIHLNFKAIPRKFAATPRSLECQHLENASVNYSGQHYHSKYVSSPVTGSQPRVLEGKTQLKDNPVKNINTYALKPVVSII